jgi:hypothetical protein
VQGYLHAGGGDSNPRHADHDWRVAAHPGGNFKEATGWWVWLSRVTSAVGNTLRHAVCATAPPGRGGRQTVALGACSRQTYGVRLSGECPASTSSTRSLARWPDRAAARHERGGDPRSRAPGARDGRRVRASVWPPARHQRRLGQARVARALDGAVVHHDELGFAEDSSRATAAGPSDIRRRPGLLLRPVSGFRVAHPRWSRRGHEVRRLCGRSRAFRGDPAARDGP